MERTARLTSAVLPVSYGILTRCPPAVDAGRGLDISKKYWKAGGLVSYGILPRGWLEDWVYFIANVRKLASYYYYHPFILLDTA